MEDGLKILATESRCFLGGNNRKVKVRNTLPSPLEFLRDYVLPGRPVIFEGLASEWPAFRKWSTEYFLSDELDLKNRLQDIAVVPPNHQADAVLADGVFELPEIRSMKFGDFCHIFDNPDIFPNAKYYLQQQCDCLRANFPKLLKDVPPSISFVDEALDAELDAVNLWMGNGASVSSFHRDPYENIYAVIRGQKRFLLLPPTDRVHVKMKPFNTVQLAQGPNDGSWSRQALDEPTTWICPSNRNWLDNLSYEAVVNPGDALYLPAGWFHEVHQNCGTIAVNYWYDQIYSPHTCLLETLDTLTDIVHERSRQKDALRKSKPSPAATETPSTEE